MGRIVGVAFLTSILGVWPAVARGIYPEPSNLPTILGWTIGIIAFILIGIVMDFAPAKAMFMAFFIGPAIIFQKVFRNFATFLGILIATVVLAWLLGMVPL